MTNILTLWAEKQNPQLINGAVVLKVEPKPIENSPNTYTFTVSIYSQSEKADEYADRWKILTEEGTVLEGQTLTKSDVKEQL